MLLPLYEWPFRAQRDRTLLVFVSVILHNWVEIHPAVVNVNLAWKQLFSIK